MILYTLFARACDPVLGLLKLGGQYSDEQIIEMLLSTCFDGLARALTSPASSDGLSGSTASAFGSRQAPCLRIPRDRGRRSAVMADRFRRNGGHGSTLMADSVPPLIADTRGCPE